MTMKFRMMFACIFLLTSRSPVTLHGLLWKLAEWHGCGRHMGYKE